MGSHVIFHNMDGKEYHIILSFKAKTRKQVLGYNATDLMRLREIRFYTTRFLDNAVFHSRNILGH